MAQEIEPIGIYDTNLPKQYRWELVINSDSTYRSTITKKSDGIAELYEGTWKASESKLFLYLDPFSKPYSIYRLKTDGTKIYAKPVRLFNYFKIFKKGDKFLTKK